MDWTILLLAAPAILVPVVLLFGFAGCGFQGRGVAPLDIPANLRVMERDFERITLAWDYLDPPPEAVTFQIARQQDGLPWLPLEDLPFSPRTYPHTGLQEGTSYFYRVRAVRNSEQRVSDWTPDPPLQATTLAWESIFTTAGMPPNPGNGDNQANNCIVQRINGVALGGAFVRLTLRGILNETTVLTGVTISKAVPLGAPQPYDSADAPVAVTFNGGAGVTLLNGGTAVSDKITFAVVQGQDLLVALDVGIGSGRILRRPLTGAVAFIGNNRAEAAQPIRTAGYNTNNDRVYCIETIELA